MVLQVDAVTVRFGGVRAVDGASVQVSAGQVAGLIGPNGAGKSTLFDVICGTRRPLSGRVTLGGRDVTAEPPHVRARLGISRTFQRLESFESLSVRDNVLAAVEAAGSVRGWRGALLRARQPVRRAGFGADDVDALLASLGLAGMADHPVSVVSTGAARLVELARALATAPSLLLLDEPSSGLTQAEVAALAGRMRILADSGVAVFVVAHDMDLVAAVCDRVYVMHLGKVIASGPPAEIRADPQVRAAYLGEGPRASQSIAPGAAAPDPVRARPAAACGAAPPRPMLELRHVVAGYGEVPALHGVSLALEAGRVHALLGPNGAGKSTLVRVAGGLLRPLRGSVLLCGREVELPPPYVLSRMGVATVPERPSVFGDLTVAEHLRLGSGRDSVALMDRVFGAFPALADHRNQTAGTLSGGEQQMLAVGRALALRPSVLIVDELSNGLAPKVVGEAYAGLRAIAGDGTAVLLVEQFVDAALAIADDVTLLRGGRVVFSGGASVATGELSRAYLGGPEGEGL